MRRTLVALAAAIALLGSAPGAQAFPNGSPAADDVARINTSFSCDPFSGQLTNAAAAGYNSMALAAGQRLPTNGCDSALRTYARQVYWRSYWCNLGQCGNAALPGTSNHGFGIAVDVPPFVRGYIDLHGKRFGYCKCWSDAAHESWHVLYKDVFNRPNPGLSLNQPILRRHSGGPGQNVFVRKAQKLLRGKGDKSVVVDGAFTYDTYKAVKRFQRAQRLKVNGVISKRVWKRLRKPAVKPQPVPVPPTPKPRGPVNGIDVSQHQGSIDWAKVKADGYEFAIAKSSEGQDFLDPSFDRLRVRAMLKAGIVPGVYHYLRPRGDRSGAREAAWFTQVISHAGYGKGFLPPVVDIEETQLGPAATCKYLHQFTQLVRRNLGVKPIVYTFPSFGRTVLGECGWLRDYRLWIANPDVDRPDVPPPWKDFTIWQTTFTGRVDGISGDVDLNRIPGGRKLLRKLRVGELPAKVRLEPSAAVDRRLGEPREELREVGLDAQQAEIDLVPKPEGDLKAAPVEAQVRGALRHRTAGLEVKI